MDAANTLKPVAPDAIQESAVKLIGTDWMLIAAGTPDSYNMMTASWGGLGYLWNRPVAYIVIRPQRYTREFVEKSDVFTLNFFDSSYRKLLNLCGAKSGREIDKMHMENLTAVPSERGSIHFAEARVVLECRKAYYQDIEPAHFLEPDIADWYPDKDYHRMYIGHIVGCLAAER